MHERKSEPVGGSETKSVMQTHFQGDGPSFKLHKRQYIWLEWKDVSWGDKLGLSNSPLSEFVQTSILEFHIRINWHPKLNLEPYTFNFSMRLEKSKRKIYLRVSPPTPKQGRTISWSRMPEDAWEHLGTKQLRSFQIFKTRSYAVRCGCIWSLQVGFLKRSLHVFPSTERWLGFLNRSKSRLV